MRDLIEGRDFEYLIIELQKMIQEKSDFLGQGQVKDFAEYRFVAGQIRGLSEAKQLVDQTVLRIEQREGDD
jgi:hypothetical protein